MVNFSQVAYLARLDTLNTVHSLGLGDIRNCTRRTNTNLIA